MAMPVGALLVRTAECLKALVQAPTVQAGLNESRYNVLDTLRRKDSGACTQTELATNLLQSESNLSTLLDRMKRDGLITRVRSESDRRMTLIGLSSAGGEALIRADQARARAAAPVLQILDDRCEAALHTALELLLHRLEHALGVAGRSASRVDGRQPRSAGWPLIGEEEDSG
jgi:DNA-binding MarR family transcriptional regulator